MPLYIYLRAVIFWWRCSLLFSSADDEMNRARLAPENERDRDSRMKCERKSNCEQHKHAHIAR